MKIGIDLGTSYSLGSRVQPDGSTALIPDSWDDERFHTPSVVVVSGGSCFVGATAEDMVEDHPELPAIRFFKRHFGQRDPIYYDDRGAQWHAEGIAALVLDKLRFDAEAEGARKVDGVVITVPAHFNDPQRKTVAAAAMLADLPLLDLIEEPVAAALHYGVTHEAHDQVLLAYDFGGGTFDATALTLDANGVYVLAKAGLSDLGGKEFDECIGAMILEQFENALGRQYEETARSLLELRRASEAIKIELCSPGTRQVHSTVILGSDAVEIEIERQQFDAAIKDALERTYEVTFQCLREAGLGKKDVNSVLLVGGSSLVPSVAARLRQEFDQEGQSVLYHEPSKAVAFGAALRTAQISGEGERFNLPAELKGVTGYNVGVRTIDPTTGQIAISTLIKKNMPLPTRISKTYYTTRADQRKMTLDFVQFGEDSKQAISSGLLDVGPLRNPRLNYPIGVFVEYKEDGTIAVEATDANTGESLEQTFGGDPSGDIQYLSTQRKLLHTLLMARS